MNIHELHEKHPDVFAKQYAQWVEHLDYDWYEPTIEYIKESYLDKYQLDIDEVHFNLGYSQGDYANFNGDMYAADYMRLHGLDVKYPALMAACAEFGLRIFFTANGRTLSADVEFPRVHPCGLFQNLDEQAWDELVDEQWDDAELNGGARMWARGLCCDMHDELRDEYEAVTSEEQFIEHCEINEVEFEKASPNVVYF